MSKPTSQSALTPSDPIETYNPASEYWANAPKDTVTGFLFGKIEEYHRFTAQYGILTRWQNSYSTYYGLADSGASTSDLSQVGENGEQFVLKVNNFRSLLQSLLTMVTSQRPALNPKAENTDAKSQNQAVLCRSVLDYYLDEQHLELKLKDATEFGLIAAEGFVVLGWDATLGKQYGVDPDTGTVIYDGDVTSKVYHPIDVIRDVWTEQPGESNWYIVREWKNKYDVAAKYPDLADKILASGNDKSPFTTYSNISSLTRTESDQIAVYQFRHKKSQAVPQGRQVEFIEGGTVLTDGALPYKSISIYRLCPNNWLGSCFGYTIAYDLLGISKMTDSLESMITTGQLTFGKQNIQYTRGANLDVSEVTEGLRGFEVNEGHDIKPLNLLQTAPELFTNLERLNKAQETISGVNQVARGNIDRDLSGSALALIASQAIQFNNGLQESFNKTLESVGTGIIELLQMYATTPRMTSVAGKSNRSRLQDFTGQDLEGIQRVTAEAVNPVSKTAAGRLSMAQDMLKSGLIKTPEQYFEVVETGQLDSMLESETTQILRIRAENEMLADGQLPDAMLTDPHVMEIREHSSVLDSIDARSNPAIVKNVTAHIQQHIAILSNPAVAQILIALGQTPIAPAGTPPPPGPQGPGPTQAPPVNAPQQLNPTPPVVQQAHGVPGPRMPSLPKNTPPDTEAAYAQLKSTT